MPDLQIIARAIDFIEDNLRSPVTVADMAESVSYSLFHFCRVFNQATHHTPYDYLMRRRVVESTHPLLNSDKNILDIALEYQFGNPETFSRAFRRMFGALPSEVRKKGRIDRRLLMPRWTLAHLEHINKGPYLLPKVEERVPFQVAGVMTLVQKEIGVIPELWDWFVHELKRMGDHFTSGGLFGISMYAVGGYPEGYLYMAGVEIEESQAVGGALFVKRFPAMKVARFIHKGKLRKLYLTLDYAYHAWLPRSGEQLSFPWVLEKHSQISWGAKGAESETAIYIPIQ
jgi:AraC family transcriptional regulator